jgi:hypothetical protein
MGRKRSNQSKQEPIHSSIKNRLGYSPDQSDAEVLRDWTSRLRRVCKPCWELKYCPYGPLVEQSPLLPPERAEMVTHNQYFKRALQTGELGERTELGPERRAFYEQWINDDEVLLSQVRHAIWQERFNAEVAASENPGETFRDAFRGELPPIHEYRVPFEVNPAPSDLNEFDAAERKLLNRKIRERKKELAQALKTGIDDLRKPLDEGRRAMFQADVDAFDPEDYPEHVPEVFIDGSCNIFGHTCPVFFAAEVVTETTTARRRGRYIPFSVKMRVVRRDNHTCQHYGKHLRDDEVEFDHKIPISKGGSSEEQNVRLTCFDCNRDKKDSVEI